MTGTDLPTVVRNPKIKVKIKTAPQQTRTDRGFTTARKPLTNPTSPVKAANHWHVPKYMRESDILTDPGRSRYTKGIDSRPEGKTMAYCNCVNVHVKGCPNGVPGGMPPLNIPDKKGGKGGK